VRDRFSLPPKILRDIDSNGTIDLNLPEPNMPAGCTTRTSMATLVRCIEGHAFDSAASERCPTCGSAASKTQLVVEHKPPRGRTGAKKIAEDIVLFGFGFCILIFIASGIRQNLPAGGIKSVVHNAWEHRSAIHDA
jgi:hypothetical protein